MASTFSAQLLVDLVYTEVLSTGLKSGPIAVRWPSFPVDMPTGTADGQINVAYYKRETAIGSAVTTSLGSTRWILLASTVPDAMWPASTRLRSHCAG